MGEGLAGGGDPRRQGPVQGFRGLREQLQLQPGLCGGREKSAEARHLGPAAGGGCPPPFLQLASPSLPEPNEVEDFELSFTGGVPGPTCQDLLCEIQNSPSPVVLHIEAAFKVLLGGCAAGWAGRVAGVGRRVSSQGGPVTGPSGCLRGPRLSSTSQPFSSVCCAWGRKPPTPSRSRTSASSLPRGA